MPLQYDPATYWEANGPHIQGPGASEGDHLRQELAICNVLEESGLEPKTILEVGAGQGRIAMLLHDWYPDAKYTGLDIGSAQVEAINALGDWAKGVHADVRVAKFTKTPYDLIVTSECLMHIPPVDMPRVANNLLAKSRNLLMVEWVPTPAEWNLPISNVNWYHDYFALFGPFDHVRRTDRQLIMLKLS